MISKSLKAIQSMEYTIQDNKSMLSILPLSPQDFQLSEADQKD